MGDVFIGVEKRRAMERRMAALGIRDQDLVEKFVIGSGRGGQKLQKTSSCVYLRHPASEIEVKCQATRSREANRFLARRELCDRLDERRLGAASRRRQEAERIRRHKRRRSRRQKERMLADKRLQAAKKESRRPVSGGDEA